MFQNNSKSNKQYWEVLKYLLEDPTRSVREIGKKMNSYRQMVWRKKKELEDNHIIWGYTAVIDESKMNHVVYMMLIKTKPLSRGQADLIIRRISKDEPRKQNVRLVDLFYLNGEYDWIIRFSAPDHATARRYYDTIRLLYDEYQLEKPVMVDVNFCLVSGGKNNPELEKLYELSQQTYQGIKHYAQALRPGILDDLGLVAAIKWLAEEVHNFSGIKIQVEADAAPPLPPETQLVLFRIVQEALNNISHHSGASQASITVECQKAEVRVSISDNGKGFDLPRQLSDFASQGKLGLTGMAERAQLIGGKLEVSSQIGKGTKIIVKAPTKLYKQTNS